MAEFNIDGEAFPDEAQRIMDAAEAAGVQAPPHPKSLGMLAMEADIQ